MFFSNKKRKKDNIFFRLDGREFTVASLRRGTENTETVLGKNGVINIVNDEIVLMCNNKIIFKELMENVKIDELMSLAGFNLRFNDRETGEKNTITVYYKYHYKPQ